jgi:hypothetical protein
VALVNTPDHGECRDWGQSMRDTIQLLLFDPTVTEARPKLAETLSIEDAIRSTRTGASGSTQGGEGGRRNREPAANAHRTAQSTELRSPLRAVTVFPAGHAISEATTKSASAQVITLRPHRDYRHTGPKAA